MLLLGHLSREEVPPALRKDALYVLRKSPQVPGSNTLLLSCSSPWILSTHASVALLPCQTPQISLAQPRCTVCP
jgi:hypothetical protein